MEEKDYFEFIQVAMGNRMALSVSISDADWHRLFDFCNRQALMGVGFVALERLHAMGVVCPAELRLQWRELALQVEKQNVLLNEQCRQLCEHYEHDGLQCCILNGQGNTLNYPEELRMRRQCGGIDVWAIPLKDIAIAVQTGKHEVEYVAYQGRRAVIEYVKMQHRLAGNEASKMEGTEVEVHYRAASLYSPWRNWRLQRWFKEQFDVCHQNKCLLGFPVLTSSVNVVYQLVHLYRHVIEGGMGLRQLMDGYYALKVWHHDVMECRDLQSQGMWSEGLGTPVLSKTEVMSVIRSFGMTQFTAAVMYVLHKVFDMSSHYYICDPNEKEGKKLLQSFTL